MNPNRRTIEATLVIRPAKRESLVHMLGITTPDKITAKHEILKDTGGDAPSVSIYAAGPSNAVQQLAKTIKNLCRGQHYLEIEYRSHCFDEEIKKKRVYGLSY